MESPPKWQRNSIYNAVVEGGLDPAECTFGYDEAEWRLTHVPTQSYFLIQGDASRYTTTTVVGDNLSSSGITNAVGLPLSVRQWALEVEVDADTPDRWAELRRHQRIVMSVGSEGVENTPFSQEEQAEILEQLGAIKEVTKTLEPLPEAQRLLFEARLDEVAAAASRVGRKDWWLMFGGAILSVLTDQLMPPDAALGILNIVDDALGHLFSGSATPQLPSWTPQAPPPVQ